VQAALSRNQIIEALYNSPEVARAIAKMNPPELRDDLKQEMFAVICNLPEDVLFDKYHNKHLLWYLLRTMKNMITSDRSTFFTTFRRPLDFLIYLDDLRVYAGDETSGDFLTRGGFTCNAAVAAVDEDITDVLDKVEPAIESLEFYERGLFKVYVESSNSCAAVARKTGIPETSVRIGVRAAKSKLKKLIRA
jgi:hypothetical protein